MCVYVCVCNTEGFYPRNITDGCDLTRMHECVQCMCACLRRIDAAMCDSEVCCVSAVKRTQEPHDSASVCVCLCARFYLCEDSLPIWKIRAFFFFKLRSLLKSLKISKQGLVLKSDDTSHFKDFLRVCALFQHKD